MFSVPAPAIPGEFRLCDPEEATFTAYSVHASPKSALYPGIPNPRPMSGALLRVQLISARQLGGSIVMDDLTGAITFTYESGTFHNLAQTANPLSLSIPECGTCGQWVGEHRNPNPTACDAFDVEPRPGTPANPLCPSEGCGQPRTHHGRPFTVACSSFEA